MLQTQVAYWQNEEAKRHNRVIEQLNRRDTLTRQQEAETNARKVNVQAYDSATNRMNAETSRARADIESINALTAQTEASTRQKAQTTNEQRLQWDREYGAKQLDIQAKNAASTALSAQGSYAQNLSYADRAKVETELMPYSTGANIAASAGKAISAVAAPASKLGKTVKTGISSLLYNLRN